MRVSELFQTIQGEGPFTGHPAFFIRLQGCSVGCHWCDTKYTWDVRKGTVTSIDEIAERVEKASPVVRLAVVTGGEPLESPDITELLTRLIRLCDVQVETSALKAHPNVPFVTYVTSPKMPSATASWRETWKHLKTYNWDYDWLKVVVNSKAECVEATKLAAAEGVPPHRIYFMPCGINAKQLEKAGKTVWEFCTTYGYKFSGRSHIWIHGAKRQV